MQLKLRGVYKNYGNLRAAENISFVINTGELTALLGPSGSGKTTVLKMIAGLELPDSGEICIDDIVVNSVEPQNRGIGFVFQNYALFRHMTVYENIAFGLKAKKIPNKIIKERVEELIELVDLKGSIKKYPYELSGGQKQRVAFARSIAPEPKLLLLDEPFAAIDAKVRAELRQWLRDMIHGLGITTIFVTHDQSEAVEVSDKIIVMDNGKIEQVGTPYEIYQKPKTKFVSSFIGENIIVKNYKKFIGFDGYDYDGAIIRPEFVEAFKDDNSRFEDIIKYAETGIIKDILFRGNSYEVQLMVKGELVKTYRSLERRPIQIGEKMNVIIYRMYLYNDKNDVIIVKNNKFDYIEFDKGMYVDDGYFVY